MLNPSNVRDADALGLRHLQQRTEFSGFAVRPAFAFNAWSPPVATPVVKMGVHTMPPVLVRHQPVHQTGFAVPFVVEPRHQMEHSGLDALAAPMQNLGVHMTPTMNAHAPIDLWLEVQIVMKHYWTFLALNLFHSQERFRQDPQVLEFMKQNQASMTAPALIGHGERSVALRRDAAAVVTDLLGRLPLHHFRQ